MNGETLTIAVKLRPAELLLLDGRVGPEAQAAVDVAREGIRIGTVHGLDEARANLVARLLSEARAAGHLGWRFSSMDYCGVCRTDPGTVKVRGRTKNRVLSGFDCSTGFIIIRGYSSLGACSACLEAVRPAAVEELSYVKAQIPEQLAKEGAPRWRRFDRCTCTKCKWAGHEGQLLGVGAIMGGLYHGECPACGAQNTAFGPRMIETVPRAFEVVPAESVAPLTSPWQRTHAIAAEEASHGR